MVGALSELTEASDSPLLRCPSALLELHTLLVLGVVSSFFLASASVPGGVCLLPSEVDGHLVRSGQQTPFPSGVHVLKGCHDGDSSDSGRWVGAQLPD